MNEAINKFCHRYEARIERTGRYYRRAEPSPWKFSDYHETSVGNQANFINITEVPMIGISLPEDRINALIEHERRITDIVDPGPYKSSKYQRVEVMLAEYEQECILRHTNPALKKAWENYQILLAMVK
jgi:hypothetical protein